MIRTAIACCAGMICMFPPSAAHTKEVGLNFVSTQSHYTKGSEQVTKRISPLNDKYDSLHDIQVTGASGIKITPELDDDGNVARVSSSEGTWMTINYTCDFSKGITEGILEFDYQDPWNAYRRVEVTINAICKPLTKEQVFAQEEQEKELDAARIRKQQEEAEAARKKEEERRRIELAQQTEEAKKAEQERKQREYRETLENKRDQAVREIHQARSQIAQAEEAMEKERRIEAVSGVSNLGRVRYLGEMIVYFNDEIDRNWRIYRENRGDAESLREIK